MIPSNIKSRARSFTGKGSAYIHAEMNKGHDGEIIIAGDMQALLWQINRIVNRWGEITGAGFKDTIGMTIALQEFGYETLSGAKSEIEWEYPMDYQIALDKAIKALEQEPCEDCITEDREKGHWVEDIINGKALISCSECLYIVSNYDGHFHYCPYCGAKLEGVIEND